MLSERKVFWRDGFLECDVAFEACRDTWEDISGAVLCAARFVRVTETI